MWSEVKGKLEVRKWRRSPKSDKQLYELHKKGFDCTTAKGCVSEPLLHIEERFRFVVMCILHLVIRVGDYIYIPISLGRSASTFRRPLGIVFKIASIVPRPNFLSRVMPLRMGKRHGSCWQTDVILARP